MKYTQKYDRFDELHDNCVDIFRFDIRDGLVYMYTLWTYSIGCIKVFVFVVRIKIELTL